MKLQNLIAACICAATSLAYAAEENTPLEIYIVTPTGFSQPLNQTLSNTTVITQEDINNSSAQTLPQLLSEQPGINVRDLYGNNAAGASVDLRGFGASATQNTLVLVDGKRINNIDSSGVQWSAIPFAAIERIEIMRGSGAVLYGDGATGGVINIITKKAVQIGSTSQISAKTGSYGMNEIQASASLVSDKSGLDVTASHLYSDGYRYNNRDEQTNGLARMRWLLDQGEISIKGALDSQNIRYPGARTINLNTGFNEAITDPRGTSTPRDYATRDGNEVSIDWTQKLADNEISMGLTQRNKNQKSYFYFSGYPSYRNTDLSVISFTPSIKLPQIFDTRNTLIAGVDLHNWNYELQKSNDPNNITQPINRVSMTQQNRAVYLQNTTLLTEATSLMAGLRNELISMNGVDIYNASAPGGGSGSAAPAGSFDSTQNAYELGLRHQLNGEFSTSGRVGRSYRFANVDEIYESNTSYKNVFQFLRPQLTDSIEVSLEQKMTDLSWRAACFDNKVQDEIHLDAFTSGIGNTNLPPSERKGVELEGKWNVIQKVAMRAAYTYTDAKFLSGVLPGGSSTQLNVDIAGKEVPLVPKHKINLGAAWTMSEQVLLNTSVAYVGSQYMDNDEANTLGVTIPAYTTTDLKLTYKSGSWNLNAAINNLFDTNYYNYAVSSQYTAGKYNVYTLPGRTMYISASYQM